jgi:hypothetical protein
MNLLSKEEHDYLVNELGFKKVGGRCPVCYTENLIAINLRKLKRN